MQRHQVYGMSLSTLFLFVLAPPSLSRDHQAEATAASNCPDLGIATSQISTSVAHNNPQLRILNPSRKTGDGCEEELVRLGRYREAIEAYKRMIEAKPRDGVLHNNLCVAYLQLGHYEEGITACSEALRMDPRLPDAYSNLAMGLSLLGNYRESAEAYRRAIRANPQFAEAHNNLGVSYNRLGHYGKAIKAFKQSIRIKPDFAEARYNLACSYLALGDRKAALAEHKVLSSLDGGLAKTLLGAILESYELKTSPNIAEIADGLPTAGRLKHR